MRILIVEDEHKIANAIQKGLMQENYSSDVAYTGSEGYELALSEDYDLIILDVMLPLMNGFEICEKLRNKKIHTPILILSAKGELDSRIKGLNAGADDYLPKPFAFSELLARVKALLRRPQTMTDAELTNGDLTLNTKTFKVYRGNKEIKLSKKEFSLLEYLLRNKNRVVTKEQIIASVWDYDSDILPNTVERYIGYLREKVDRPFKNKKPMIKTLRGFGYEIQE